MSRNSEWIITVSPDYAIGAVASAVRAKGFKVDAVLSAIGSITGHADAHAAASVRAIPGVLDVTESIGFDVGPPGSHGPS